MMPLIRQSWVFLLTAFAFLPATAQPVVAPVSAPAPADAALPFRSLSDDYEPYTEQKLISWREANDTVGRIGGWREYAREANPQTGGTPSPPGNAPSPAAPAAPAAKDPHAGHGKQ